MSPEEIPGLSTESSADVGDHLDAGGLKRHRAGHATRGAAVSLVSQGLKFLISIVGTAVLARLLTPNDYGLIGMAAVVTGFVAMFKDLGLSTATIQRPSISIAELSTLFWINLTLGVLIALVTIAIAPLVAWFYGDPRLVSITAVSALGFIFGGLLVQHEAVLQRQMRFATLAVIDLSSLLAGYTVAVILASRGMGYWALVSSQLVLALTRAMGIWLVGDWRPRLQLRVSAVRSMLTFGGHLTGFSIMNYFARNLDNALIGRYWGPQQLGFYARAYQLLLLPIEQINAPITMVALPVLSRLTGSPQEYRKAYLRLLEKITMVTMPLMAFMIVASDWVVRLALGPQWDEVSRLLSLLGLVGLVQPVANTVGWLFITQGRTHDMLRWGMIGGTITIGSIAAGLPWGATGVATSYSLCGLLIVFPLLLWFVARSGPIRATDFYSVMMVPTGAAVCVGGTLLVFRHWIAVSSSTLGLAGGLVITVGITLLVFSLSKRGRAVLRDVLRSLSVLTQRRPVLPLL